MAIAFSIREKNVISIRLSVHIPISARIMECATNRFASAWWAIARPIVLVRPMLVAVRPVITAVAESAMGLRAVLIIIRGPSLLRIPRCTNLPMEDRSDSRIRIIPIPALFLEVEMNIPGD